MGQSEALSGRWLVADVVALGHLPWRKTALRDASAQQGGLASVPGCADNKLATLDSSLAPGQSWKAALGLERLWDRSVDQLSGGERQRVLIGRALAADARVTLLDEPGLHLDPLYHMRLANWLARSRSRNKLVLTATHDLNWAFNADAILLLSSNEPPLLASPHSLDLHRAIECAMEGALTIRQVDDQAGKQWYAFPKRTVIR
jgi:ABC-type hemin transport system ATPase subunit